MAKNRIRFVININSAVVCFRTSATDENPVIFRKIDDDTAHAIIHKKVNALDVIDALMKVEASKEGFSWREYDRQRQAAEKLLNVSRREMIPVEDDPNAEEATSDDGDVVSLKDLGLATEEEPKKSQKKASKKAEQETKESEESNAPADSTEGVNY